MQSGDKGLHVTIHLDHVLTHATVWTANYDQQGLAASELQSQIAAATVGIAQSAISARRADPAEMDDAALGLALKLATNNWTMTHGKLPGATRPRPRTYCPRAQIRPGYLNLSQMSSEMMKYASPDEIPQLRADAAKAASQALALDPTNGGAYVALAMQVPNGRWAEREALYRRGIAAAPNDAEVQAYLADELSAVGRLREALEFYTRAQALDPTAQPINANLATAQVETGHVAEGLSLINRAAMIWPSSFVIWQARFYILANFGHVDEARAMLDATRNIPTSLQGGSMVRRAYLDALKPGHPRRKGSRRQGHPFRHGGRRYPRQRGPADDRQARRSRWRFHPCRHAIKAERSPPGADRDAEVSVSVIRGRHAARPPLHAAGSEDWAGGLSGRSRANGPTSAPSRACPMTAARPPKQQLTATD